MKTFEEKKMDLMKMKNVVGVGTGIDHTIEVSVAIKVSKIGLAPYDIIPSHINGIKTNVTETGIFRTFQNTKRYRPAPGGVSCGHYKITAGTLGMWIQKDDRYFILSNNHILANCNNAAPGDKILQPAPMDGGYPGNDTIALLSKFIPIIWKSSNGGGGGICPFANGVAKFLNLGAKLLRSSYRLKAIKIASEEDPYNLVDCALAEVINPTDVKNTILNIGPVSGTSEGLLNTKVIKTGRTTGTTQGQIMQTNLSVTVSYGNGRTALYKNQLMTGAMSQGGDSGSILVKTDDFTVVGLLYAGSDNRTIYNRIQDVETALNITI